MAETDRDARIFREMQDADAMRQARTEGASGPSLADKADGFIQAVGEAVADIRHKVVEEGYFGRAVTPEAVEVHTHGPAMPPYSYADYCRDNGLDKKAPEAPAERETPANSVER